MVNCDSVVEVGDDVVEYAGVVGGSDDVGEVDDGVVEGAAVVGKLPLVW